MGRPLGYDPDTVLDAAMQIFWSKGYEATSLQDLLKATGLSKSSLYQAFGGKKDLFLRCINRYRERIGNSIAEVLEMSSSGRDFIERMLLNCANEARRPNELRRGCLLMNTATEWAQRDLDVAQRVSSGFDGLRIALKRAVERGQTEGEICPKLDPDAAAGFLIASLGGIKTVVKGGASREEVREIVAIALRALD